MASEEPDRALPNIIITGTPGVGKSVHCEQLVRELSEAAASGNDRFQVLSVNDVVKDKKCHEGWDEVRKCWIVDEDKLLDAIEDEVKKGGWVVDWHACDMFPKSWIDLVVVLRCEKTDTLWDRLKEREYDDAKLQENLDAEIFGVLAEEAREAFDEEIVIELKSEEAEDVDTNCERIISWIEAWKKQHVSKA